MSVEVLEAEEIVVDDATISSDGHIPFPSIEQFRNTVKKVRDRSAHNGLPLPVLKFRGTVKLHGTNAGVAFHTEDRMLVQSRTNIIEPGKTDNAGFAAWVHENIEVFKELGERLRFTYVNFDDPIVVYGEWCGGGIQKGVAINGLPKMFVVFAIRIYKEDHSIWFSPKQIILALADTNVKSIYDFPTFTLDIDFARPELAQNILGDLTTEVEKQCPVGLVFGNTGTGEGIVWRAVDTPYFDTRGLTFKVKGEKHSESKVKTLAPVDVEKINSMRELVAAILTEHRLEKKLDDFREQGFDFDIKNTGQFLRIVSTDVNKEEADTILASGLDRKAVMAIVSNDARQWWMKKLDTNL